MSPRHAFLLVLALAGLALLLVALGGCHVGYSFRGPGWSDGRVVADDLGDTVLVVVTTGEIAPGRSGAFFDRLDDVRVDMASRDGLIGYAVRKQLAGRTVWTQSAWRDEAALRAFLRADLHRQAARGGGIPRPSFRATQVWLPVDELPLGWDRVEALLAAGAAGAASDGAR